MYNVCLCSQMFIYKDNSITLVIASQKKPNQPHLN